MNFVDIAVLGIIALFVIIGYFRGFLGTLLSFAGTIIALAAAYFLAKTVATMIGGIGGLRDSLGGVFSGMFDGEVFTKTIDMSSIEAVSEGLLGLGIPDFLIAILAEPIVAAAAATGLNTPMSLATYLGPVIVDFILLVISFIIIFFVVKLIMMIVQRFVKKVLLNKTLRIGDRILGGVFGIVKAYFILCLLILLLEVLIPAVPDLGAIQVMLNESTLTKTIVDNNLIKKLIEMINIPGLLSGL